MSSKMGGAVFFFFILVVKLAASKSFTYNGFRSANLTLDGIADITSSGVLELTHHAKINQGHGWHPDPITFKNSNGIVISFSTTFVFAIVSPNPNLTGHGIAFVVAPQRGLPGSLPTQYLGLFNESNNGNSTNHVFAVELDTVKGDQFEDINDNHVGIDINSLFSNVSASAAYYANVNGVDELKNLTLTSGSAMQLWVDYDGNEKVINVTLAPIKVPKPQKPLLSLKYDLSSVLNEFMYVGFSSSTGSVPSSHFVLGWSFSMGGPAPPLSLSMLPGIPRLFPKELPKFVTIGLPILFSFMFVLVISSFYYAKLRKREYEELLEDWESDYGPHRFKYKDLYIATRGFRDEELLGEGGFGSVYRGVLPDTKMEVAVKRVSHESKQGIREFISEIVSIGRLRHRNLVTLLGYCRRKRELLLVYDFMPNGSLDKHIHNVPGVTLNWKQRFHVIKGVASGLLYLHEEWDQVVIHRDIKASNVMLDSEFNGRLGDFGIARLYDHGTDPQTTRIVGTIGYLAPEQYRVGKATTWADVFAFGAFVLEVACGRRPIEPQAQHSDIYLVDTVFSCWKRGNIAEAADPHLGNDYMAEEMELVLKLGLICSDVEPSMRPGMRQIVQYLKGEAPLPEISSPAASNALSFAHHVNIALDDDEDDDEEDDSEGLLSDQSTSASGTRPSVAESVLSKSLILL
ncbi:Protein kinase domain [Dillenia turbinata]|uniref:non-specific serine/threonine protein kinase n=1 Tax=Dillenia turbinata TaxID=194707 RepID=A0AAN8ZM91_9MAGN